MFVEYSRIVNRHDWRPMWDDCFVKKISSNVLLENETKESNGKTAHNARPAAQASYWTDSRTPLELIRPYEFSL